MNWYETLYFGKTAEKKKDRIIHEIDHAKYRGNTYLIALAANPQNQLEFFTVHQLRFSYIQRTCPLIVGIASGYEEALEVVQRIVKEVYDSTGDVKIREYFEKGN